MREVCDVGGSEVRAALRIFVGDPGIRGRFLRKMQASTEKCAAKRAVKTHWSTLDQKCRNNIVIIYSRRRTKTSSIAFAKERESTVTLSALSRSRYPICDPDSGHAHVSIREPLQPSSLSLRPLLALQVRQFLIPGTAVPAVGTIEQRRVVEPYAGPVTTAVGSRAPLEPKHAGLRPLLDASLARRIE